MLVVKLIENPRKYEYKLFSTELQKLIKKEHVIEGKIKSRIIFFVINIDDEENMARPEGNIRQGGHKLNVFCDSRWICKDVQSELITFLLKS